MRASAGDRPVAQNITERFVDAVVATGETDKERGRRTGVPWLTIRNWRLGAADPSARSMATVFERMGEDWERAVCAPASAYRAQAREGMAALSYRIRLRRPFGR